MIKQTVCIPQFTRKANALYFGSFFKARYECVKKMVSFGDEELRIKFDGVNVFCHLSIVSEVISQFLKG